MSPKELLDNAIKYDGSLLEGVFEKKDINGETTGHYVVDSNGRELVIYPGDYLVRDNIHKLTFEVIREANVKEFAAAIGYQVKDSGEA